MNKTKNYNLTEWEPADQFNYNEINKDNSIIDQNLHAIKTEADTNKQNIENEVSERKKAVIDSAHGGSGKTTLKESANAYIGSLDEDSTDIVDDDSFITNDNNNVFYKRKALNVWNWIKSKISSVLGLTASKYNGVSEKANKDKNGKDIPTEYSNKEYANNILNRYSTIVSIDYATTANIKLYGVQSIDGISIIPAKTVLVKNQSNAIENGIYESSNTSWKRRPSFDTDAKLKHKLFKINQGNSNKGRFFYIPSEYFTVGKTDIIFSENNMWEYTKSEISSDLGLTKDNYQGNARNSGLLNNHTENNLNLCEQFYFAQQTYIPKQIATVGATKKISKSGMYIILGWSELTIDADGVYITSLWRNDKELTHVRSTTKGGGGSIAIRMEKLNEGDNIAIKLYHDLNGNILCTFQLQLLKIGV